MIQHQGIYLPDGETHLVDWMTKNGEIVRGRGSYQIKKFRRALSRVKNFRTAVDVGAHCGMWSMQMYEAFHRVHSFEPVAAHRECFLKNCNAVELRGEEPDPVAYDTEWIRLHACALGEAEGSVRIETAETSSGDSRVGGAGDIPLKTLDSFHFEDVDFIKLDCEGYELFALRGGEQTIRRCKPVIIVEQKPGRAQRFGLPETGAVSFLELIGYRLADVMSGDYIMVPK